MRLREWMLNPDDAPAWLPLLVLAPVALLAVILVAAVDGPWWTVPIPLGIAAALWQFVAERLRARQCPQAD